MKLFKQSVFSVFVFFSFFLITSVAFASINVNVIANPPSVPYSSTSNISWSSTGSGTIVCDSGGHGTGTRGNFTTPVLTSNINYLVSCHNGTGCTSDWGSQYNAVCQSKTNPTSCDIPMTTGSYPFSHEHACIWDGDSGHDSALVTVAAPVFGVTVTATPNQVPVNGNYTSTIHWDSVLADSCTSSTGQGGNGPSGNFTVTPNTTTSYTVTCTRQASTGVCAPDWSPNIEVYSSNVYPANDLGIITDHCALSRYNSESTCNLSYPSHQIPDPSSWGSPGGADPIQQICHWIPGNSQTTSVTGNATVTVDNDNLTVFALIDAVNGTSTPPVPPDTHSITTSSGVQVNIKYGVNGVQNYNDYECDKLNENTWQLQPSLNPPSSFDINAGAVGPDIPVSCRKKTDHTVNASDTDYVYVSPVILNGACSSPERHYDCEEGTPANQSGNSTTWTWDCQGSSNGGTTDHCTESIILQPDLIASAPNQSTAVVGVAKPFFSTITNQGTAGTGASFTNLFQTATGFDDPQHPLNLVDYPTASMSALSANGGQGSTSALITFPSAGTYYIRACADKRNRDDVNGVIVESIEDNNCSPTPWKIITVTSTAEPDLIASAPSSSMPTIVGVPKTFTSTITNQGTAATDYQHVNTFTNLFQTTTAIDVHGNPTGVVVDYPVLIGMPTINAGNSKSTTSPLITFDTAGTYYIRACADKSSAGNTGVITESNEDNNCSNNPLWTTLTVTATPKPDLVASSPTPTTAVAGVPTMFFSTITNQGTVATNYLGVKTFTNLFQTATGFIDSNTPIAPVVYTTAPMSSLSAGGGNLTTRRVITFATAGTYYMRACADLPPYKTNGVIVESIENNNCSAWKTITVTNPSETMSVDLSADPMFMFLPDDATKLTWVLTGTVTPDACTASGDSLWSGSKLATGGSETVSGLTLGTHTFNITCKKVGMPDANSSISVNVFGKDSVDGACDKTHFNCSSGIYKGGGGDDGTNWTWICSGVNNGKDSLLCTEPSVCPAGTSGIPPNCIPIPIGGAISVTLMANPQFMTLSNATTVLTWTPTGSPTTCIASGDQLWLGQKSTSVGSEIVSGLALGTHTFIITCTKSGMVEATDSVSVNVSQTPECLPPTQGNYPSCVCINPLYALPNCDTCVNGLAYPLCDGGGTGGKRHFLWWEI